MLKCYCLLFNKYTMCHPVILPACVPLGEGGGRGGQVEGEAVGREGGRRRGERREGFVGSDMLKCCCLNLPSCHSTLVCTVRKGEGRGGGERRGSGKERGGKRRGERRKEGR